MKDKIMLIKDYIDFNIKSIYIYVYFNNGLKHNPNDPVRRNLDSFHLTH